MRSLSCVGLILASAVAGCGVIAASRDARIVNAGGGEMSPAGVIVPDAPSGRPHTNGHLIICLDRPGRAVIDRIEPKDPFGPLSLDAFTVVPNAMETGDMGFGETDKTIAELGLATGPVVVDKKCPEFKEGQPPSTSEPKSVALVLQWSRRGDASAGNHGITLHYTSGGNKYEAFFPWEILLCAPGDTTTEDCRPAE